jgi:hypothetical protein
MQYKNVIKMSNNNKNNIEMKKLTFRSMITIALLLICSIVKVSAQDPGYTFFDEKLEIKLHNFRYDYAQDAIVFELQMQASEGYLAGATKPASALSIKYALYLEDGVELQDMQNNFGTMASPAPFGITSFDTGIVADTLFCITIDKDYDDDYSTMPDFTAGWQTVGTVAIPVTSTQKPTWHTYIELLPLDPDDDDYFEFRSFWTNHEVDAGFACGGFDFKEKTSLQYMISYSAGKGDAGTNEAVNYCDLNYCYYISEYETEEDIYEIAPATGLDRIDDFICWIDQYGKCWFPGDKVLDLDDLELTALYAEIIVFELTICEGESTTLSLDEEEGVVWTWYAGGCGEENSGTYVGTTTDDPLEVSPTTTTIYYVRYEGDENNSICKNVTVTVNENVTPEFTFANTLTYCQGETNPETLPTTSSNGITGTWSPSTINTATVTTTPDTYTFTPTTGLCATTKEITVTIEPKYLVTYYENGGTSVVPPALDHCVNTTVTVQSPPAGLSRIDHTFIGWAYAFDATTPNFPWDGTTFTVTPEFTITGVVDLFAVWALDLCDPATPPSATSPQMFCTTAKVEDLRAEGANLTWYNSVGAEMLPGSNITAGIYYVTQKTSAGCEGEWTPVTVIINPNVVIDAPRMPGEIEICEPTTLAEIPTNGNPNINWYTTMTGGSPIDPTTVVLNTSGSPYYFYAGLVTSNGLCESVQRVEVIITLVSTISIPEIESPQHFCDGALVANLDKPNDQILWYYDNIDTTPLNADDMLEDHTYYAAQKAGNCISARVAVSVVIDQYPAPTAPAVQTMCKVEFVSDLEITGAGIKWYDETHTEILTPETTPVEDGKFYYARQTAGDDCESDETAVKVVRDCYTPYGTVFPFVHTETAYDNEVVTMAKLYSLPPTTASDKIGYILKQKPIREVVVTYYDCTVDEPVVGAPKNPGIIGNTNNPGLPIDWASIGVTPTGSVSPATITATDKCSNGVIGKYYFTDLAPDDYVLEISRQGFLTRYAQITVGAGGNLYLGHREILAGDVNGDRKIDDKDLSAIRPKVASHGSSNFAWKYDFDGNGVINNTDIGIIRLNLNALSSIYLDTKEFMGY